MIYWIREWDVVIIPYAMNLTLAEAFLESVQQCLSH